MRCCWSGCLPLFFFTKLRIHKNVSPCYSICTSKNTVHTELHMAYRTWHKINRHSLTNCLRDLQLVNCIWLSEELYITSKKCDTFILPLHLLLHKMINSTLKRQIQNCAYDMEINKTQSDEKKWTNLHIAICCESHLTFHSLTSQKYSYLHLTGQYEHLWCYGGE